MVVYQESVFHAGYITIKVNHMQKLLFFDIDGTLAYPRQLPSESTVSAIRTARNNGHKVFTSTGRTADSIPEAVNSIGFDGGIFSAGGIVSVGNTIIAAHYMEDCIVQRIKEFLYSNTVFFTLETAAGRFNSENAADVLSRVDMTHVSPEMQRFTEGLLYDSTAFPMAEYAGQPINKISYYSANRTISAQLSLAFQNDAKVVQFNNIPDLPLTIGEISDYSVNKGVAVKDICNYFGKNTSDCIAFGDSMNDSEMILVAGLGVAMGNADSELKAIADLICGNCENDGIANCLHSLGLI